MNWDEEFDKAQRSLSLASRNDTWWRTLPEERRATLGRAAYRAKCKEARARMKAADEHCHGLVRSRKAARKAEDPAGRRPPPVCHVSLVA